MKAGTNDYDDYDLVSCQIRLIAWQAYFEGISAYCMRAIGLR